MGQLGLGEDVSEKSRPFPLSLGQLPVMTIACGGMHSLAVTQDGKVSDIYQQEVVCVFV